MKRALKRAGALVLGLVFLLALLPGGALAATTVASGDCGDNLTWTLDSDGVLTIEGAGNMYEYYTNTPWASYSSQITQVRVTGGVTSICDYAFYNCRSIVSVQLPAGLTRIGSNAFYMCLALAEITIPDSVTIIGAKAFASTALSRVTIPAGVASIGDGAFSSCSSMAEITVAASNSAFCSADGVLFDSAITRLITCPARKEGAFEVPAGVTVIDADAFLGCSSITSVTIPASVTQIGDGAFRGCMTTDFSVDGANPAYRDIDGVLFDKSASTLVQFPCRRSGSYEIPDGVTGIGYCAFGNCYYLTDVLIPASVTSFANSPFFACLALKRISIPVGVTSITYSAFAYCSSLEYVYIPSSVTSIAAYAFEGCTALTTVDYGGSADEWNAISIGSNNGPLLDAALQCVGAGGSCGDNLTWALLDGDTLTISGTGDMYDYSMQAAPWYSHSSEILEIRIAEGVTSIGDSAFYGMQTAPSALPSTLTRIGNYAFYSSGVDAAAIPAGVTTIGDYAFYSCSRLESATIPESVTSIGAGPFADCGELTQISVDAANPNYMDVGGVLFDKAGTTLLQYPGGRSGSYSIPDSVTDIAAYAFFGSTGLTDVTIRGGVSGIANYSFAKCSSLTDIVVSEANPNYKDIDGVLFDKSGTVLLQCPGSKIGAFSFPDGVTRVGTAAFYGCAGLTNAAIPDGVTVIGDSAFSSCAALTTVELPDSLTSIGMSAFSNCTALTGIAIPDGITSIGYGVFMGCSALTDVTIPDSVTDIGGWAFSVTGLRSLTIPDGVVSIGSYAFGYCFSLSSVTVPVSVTSIFSNAFAYCFSLSSVCYGGSPEDWAAIQIGSGNDYLLNASITFGSISEISGVCGDGLTWTLDSDGLLTVSGTGDMWDNPEFNSYRDDIRTVVIEPGATSIGNRAFSTCISLTSVTIPDSVTSIGSCAFRSCTDLTDATIPQSVTYIGESAFEWCDALTDLTIPDSVTYIGDYAFSDCGSLTDFTVSGGNPAYTAVDGVLFNKAAMLLVQYPCGRSGAYSIPQGVTAIGCGAFADCRDLTEVTIPQGVTSIGDYAFRDCYSLTGVTIPEGVTSIGEGAFCRCGGLTSITIPGSVTSIGDYAFSGCSALTDVYYGGSRYAWNAITIGSDNDYLLNAGICFASSLAITADLTDYVGHAGTTAIFTVEAEGEGLTYQWYVKNLTATRFTKSSVTSPTYSVTLTEANSGRQLYCVVTDADGNTAQTNTVSMTIAETVASGACGDGLTWTLDSAGRLTVSGAGDMWDDPEFSSYRDDIRTVVIEPGATSIGRSAFARCGSLTSAAIPNSVTSIGYYAFGACISLTDVTIPDSVTSIGNDAFGSCYSLTEVTIPESLTHIGDAAFASCIGLTGFTVSEGNPAYTAVDGVLFNKALTELVQYPCGRGGAYSIPQSVTAIGFGAFASCSGLTEMTIPRGVTSIGDIAFAYCHNLTEIGIPDTVTSIGFGAFCDCSALTDVYYGGTREAWEAIAIDGSNEELLNAELHFAPSLAITAELEDYVGHAGRTAAFTVEAEGEGLTYQWWVKNRTATKFTKSSVTSDTYSVTLTEANSGRQLYCVVTDAYGNTAQTNTVSMTVADVISGECGDGLTWTLDSDGLLTVSGTGDMWDIPACDRYSDEILTVVIESGVTGIGNYAFCNCWYLTEVTIPQSVTSIGIWAFYHCDSLTGVTIPDSVASIGQEAFAACDNMTAIVVDANNPYFSSADGLLLSKDGKTLLQYPGGKSLNVFIPDGITTIGDFALCSCHDIETVTIPNSVTSIGHDAFSSCWSLTSVTIPQSVTSIGDFAFYGCGALADVYFGGSREAWNAIAVGIDNECLQDAEIHFPSALAITADLEDFFGPIGSVASFTVEAEGEDLTYQWWVKNRSATKFSRSSVTSPTYSVTLTASNSGRQLYCVVSDAYGNTVQTNTVTMTAVRPLTIIAEPEDYAGPIGSVASFTVAAEGEGLAYQWWVKSRTATKFSKSSITAATYSVTLTEARDGNQIYCVVTDAYGATVQTSTVTMTAAEPLALTADRKSDV